MTMQDITALMDRFDRGTAQVLKVTMDGCSLELQRGIPAGAAPVTSVPAASAQAAPAPADGPCVRAPLVGTYYAAPSPDQAPFLSVGQQVKKGQTLCLIEAMKMMSEISAPCDCVIEEILVDNGALVAYDEALVRYRAL